MSDSHDEIGERLLNAALEHVPFDGWSDATFRAAIADCAVAPALARALYPRGAVDLALAFHARGDAAMVKRLNETGLDSLRLRDKIAAAVRYRLEAVPDRELVRRGTTLFSLPQHAADGARAVWDTCDLIWTTLGDSSEDYNWYTKRATLAAVYSATLLYWLGDESDGHTATWEFLDRRIDNVMQVEKLKADVNRNPLLKPLLAGPNWLLGHIRAPRRGRMSGLPGKVAARNRA